MGPSHLRRLDSIVDSLILPDLTTVVWAPHGHDEAIDALRGLADVVLLDSIDQPDMRAAVKRVSGLADHVYVVDLAWLRSTPWRERIAATLDPDQWRPALRKITRVVIRHRPDSAVSGVLLLGWFASRLGWEPGSLVEENGRHHGRASAGKTRGEGGSRAGARAGRARPGRDRPGDGRGPDRCRSIARAAASPPSAAPRTARRRAGWCSAPRAARPASSAQGIRQALLRDPTYAPAVMSAEAFLS